MQRFQEEAFPPRQEAFEALGSGQQPKLLLVTCSDSRIDPALLTQTEPGEIFVVRNAGNLVPPSDAPPGGEAATIEYGVKALGIRHIAVCGHTHCGAMAALRDPAAASGLECVPPWLSTPAQLSTGRLPSATAATRCPTPCGQRSRTARHLRSFPFIAQAIEEDGLQLHAWVYDFVSGQPFVGDSEGKFQGLVE